MNIILKHNQPISFRARRLSYVDKQQLQLLLDDLIKKNIIRPSTSAYASPIVLTRKKNGEIRLCVDSREFNKITIKDNYPTQLIEDNLDRLKDKLYFTALDLRDGFFHVKMAESSIQYTSFVTPLGQYEYLRLPFGLCNGPKIFMRYISQIFEPLDRVNKVLLYADDILIASSSIKEHLQTLSEVFSLAGKNHLRFRLDKCSFAQNEIEYLGYQVNKDGIQPSHAHNKAIENYPIPRNTKEAHRFVCLASYFRKFVNNFSVVAKPIYDLIRKNKEFVFAEKEIKSFETLKQCLISSPILAIYSPKLESELHCDASASGFGAIFVQRQSDGVFKPVFYFSQRTTAAEANYHIFEPECLAVVCAIKRFHVYLAGIKFRVITDCDSFRLTLSKRDINPRISGWALFHENYEYEIQHRPGTRMGHVDALSRCYSILVIEGNSFERTLSIQQDRDSEIIKIRDRVEKNEDKYFEIRDGLVYRKDDKRGLLFYVPESMINNVIRASHANLGHIGAEKVVSNITKVYWFPRMREKAKDYIGNCLKCIEYAPLSGKGEGFLRSLDEDNLPFLTLHADHLGPLEKTGKGYKHILLIIDGFTKFVKLYPCKTTASNEVIKHFSEYFQAYSKPFRIITDRGTAFTSDAFTQFLSDESVQHVLTAVATPQANGQAERINRFITPMLAPFQGAQ